MARNSTGTYTLPIGAFSPGGVIKSSDHNSNYSDIATALTQSLATTGVSSMTGPFKAASGVVNAPSITFSSGIDTGFYLSGTGQIGIATAGGVLGTLNSDKSVTLNGALSVAGAATVGGNLAVTGAITQAGANVFFPPGAVLLFGNAVAPSGWTKITLYNDYIPRITTAGVLTTGGTKGFTTVFNASITNLAAHTHSVTDPGHGHLVPKQLARWDYTSGLAQPLTDPTVPTGTYNTGPSTTGISLVSSGTGASTALDVYYADVILASKN